MSSTNKGGLYNELMDFFRTSYVFLDQCEKPDRSGKINVNHRILHYS
jgi:hypothetical protein